MKHGGESKTRIPHEHRPPPRSTRGWIGQEAVQEGGLRNNKGLTVLLLAWKSCVERFCRRLEMAEVVAYRLFINKNIPVNKPCLVHGSRRRNTGYCRAGRYAQTDFRRQRVPRMLHRCSNSFRCVNRSLAWEACVARLPIGKHHNRHDYWPSSFGLPGLAGQSHSQHGCNHCSLDGRRRR